MCSRFSLDCRCLESVLLLQDLATRLSCRVGIADFAFRNEQTRGPCQHL